MEDFVSHKDGPLHGLNTQFILSLPQDEVEKLAEEDEPTAIKRETLKRSIANLTRARAVAEGARSRTRQLAVA